MVHYRLAQRRSETHFSEVLRHGFAPVNRVTLRMSHLREVNRARSVVCDNPIGTVQTNRHQRRVNVASEGLARAPLEVPPIAHSRPGRQQAMTVPLRKRAHGSSEFQTPRIMLAKTLTERK